MKWLKRILKWTGGLLLLYVGGFLLYGTLTDWTPDPIIPLEALEARPQEDAKSVISDSSLTLVTWNIGYAGLGETAYFFYDRGDFFWTDMGGVRTPENEVEAALNGAEVAVSALAADFYLLQEVDSFSRRSHYVMQIDSLRDRQPRFQAHFTKNYKNNRVPIPIFQPWDHYGYVRSGLLSMSRFKADSAVRLALPGELSWPTRLFQLDRCVLRQSYPTSWGDTLVVYNVHLSAYDDGSKKAIEMTWLRQQLIADVEAGYKVVVGGDWNQVPPGFDYARFSPLLADQFYQLEVKHDFMPPGWKWIYDPGEPTNRKAQTPYSEKESPKTLIDFFLVGPGLSIDKVQTINQQFQFSDHQPVRLQVTFQ
ncbi:MAG: endonuclease/exonuclease/phosphatase family protein [Bacteroidota bacterium]